MSYSDSSFDQTSAYAAEPVAVRRPDSVAGLLLILAGLGIGISLLLDWFVDGKGYDIFKFGLDNAGSFFSDGVWQPLVIVFGGAVLLLIGLIAFIPGKSRRAMGLIALLIAAAIVAAVLTALITAKFDFSAFKPGFIVVIAAAVLALLGALKAAVTPPKRVS
ncbi:MAG: hypothetical protein H0T54_01820 [Geodermatophilaceae bacterium]|nr:hypothetical protein [Geodermatophilaceae bacterium]